MQQRRGEYFTQSRKGNPAQSRKDNFYKKHFASLPLRRATFSRRDAEYLSRRAAKDSTQKTQRPNLQKSLCALGALASNFSRSGVENISRRAAEIMPSQSLSVPGALASNIFTQRHTYHAESQRKSRAEPQRGFFLRIGK